MTKAGTAEAGPVVTEALLVPLREALRGLLVAGLPAEAGEEALRQLLARLRVGVEQLRPNKQLAPWMAEVVGKVAGGTTLETGEGRIADTLLPLLGLLPPEHAEVLRLTDHGPLTQHAVAARFGIALSALKSRVHSARRLLRRIVLSGLRLLAPDITDTSAPSEPCPDTRPPRRRASPSVLLPAFTAALEDLVRPWVPANHVHHASKALFTRLRAALTTRRRQTRLGPWLHAILYATLTTGPWSSTLLASPSLAPTPADLAALATGLAPLLSALTPEQSGAILLFDFSAGSLHTAARQAGTDRPTFQNRLQRARVRLTSTLRTLAIAGPT